MYKLLFIIVSLVYMNGCSVDAKYKISDITSQKISPDSKDYLSKTYNKDFDSVWNAIKNTLFEKGYITRSASKEGGIISTDVIEYNTPTKMWLLQDEVTLWHYSGIELLPGESPGESRAAERLKKYPYSIIKFKDILSGLYLFGENVESTPTVRHNNGKLMYPSYNSNWLDPFSYDRTLFKSPDDLYFDVNKSKHQLQIRVRNEGNTKTRVDVSMRNVQAYYYESFLYDLRHPTYKYNFDDATGFFFIDRRYLHNKGSGWMKGKYHKQSVDQILFDSLEKELGI